MSFDLLVLWKKLFIKKYLAPLLYLFQIVIGKILIRWLKKILIKFILFASQIVIILYLLKKGQKNYSLIYSSNPISLYILFD